MKLKLSFLSMLRNTLTFAVYALAAWAYQERNAETYILPILLIK
jgi:hypothetical protein